MKDSSIIIMILSSVLLLLIFKNEQLTNKTKEMNKASEVLQKKVRTLEYSNEEIRDSYKDSIKQIELEIKETKKSHIKELKRIKSLSAKQVKSELLESITIKDDTSKPSRITERESKELLIEKRTLQYQSKKVGLDNAILGAENNALNSINYNLNAIIVNKDLIIDNKIESLRLEKRKNRRNLLKIGGICVGVGYIVGSLL